MENGLHPSSLHYFPKLKAFQGGTIWEGLQGASDTCGFLQQAKQHLPGICFKLKIRLKFHLHMYQSPDLNSEPHMQ